MKNYDLLGLDNPIIIDRKKHLRRISTGMKKQSPKFKPLN